MTTRSRMRQRHKKAKQRRATRRTAEAFARVQDRALDVLRDLRHENNVLRRYQAMVHDAAALLHNKTLVILDLRSDRDESRCGDRFRMAAQRCSFVHNRGLSLEAHPLVMQMHVDDQERAFSPAEDFERMVKSRIKEMGSHIGLKLAEHLVEKIPTTR